MTRPSLLDCTLEARDQYDVIDWKRLASQRLYLSPLEDYLVGTYPPLKAMGAIGENELFESLSDAVNVYVHLPFCGQYCTFCHFAKEINPTQDRMENYLEALDTQLQIFHARAGRRRATTVFFGGGTPSYLNAAQLERLLKRLHSVFDLTGAEFSFELHPSVFAAVDVRDRLRVLRDNGVNRWVAGVQSMDDVILRKLNRRHTAADVYEMIELLHAEGINNLSLDLIYGLPYQTLENWYHSATTLIDAGIEKFNIFPLLFKAGDPIARQYARDPMIFPDERERGLMHYVAQNLMNAEGFTQEPVFYWSKAGRNEPHSLQQELKFTASADVNLVPFGISGFGYMSGAQLYLEPTIDRYVERVRRGEFPVWRGIKLTRDDQMRREIMFSLRGSGLDLARYEARFGVDPRTAFPAIFQNLDRSGLIVADQYKIRLTDVGTLTAGAIALAFFSGEVLAACQATQDTIFQPKVDPLEVYDFSPASRVSTFEGLQVAVGGKMP